MLQAKLEELEREVNVINANNDRLQRSYSELTELQVSKCLGSRS